LHARGPRRARACTATSPQVVGDLAPELRASAEDARIAFLVGPFAHVSVACAGGVLISLISNLVRNAIKYMGYASERRIAVRIIDAGTRVRVEVVETGPGIPPGIEAKIFEPYVRAPGVVQPGIGLLATVKRMADAHGGAVGLRSSAGRGCLFWFELPKAHFASADVA
jgi:signal transduction histidine kinase